MGRQFQARIVLTLCEARLWLPTCRYHREGFQLTNRHGPTREARFWGGDSRQLHPVLIEFEIVAVILLRENLTKPHMMQTSTILYKTCQRKTPFSTLSAKTSISDVDESSMSKAN